MAFSEDKSNQPVYINKALDWDGMKLSEQVKSVRFITDGAGNAYGLFAVIIDPTYTTQNILARERVVVRDGVGDVNQAVLPTSTTSVLTDLDYNGTSGFAVGINQIMAFKPSTAAFEKIRTPDTFKTVAVAAATGTTDIWTPAAGKKIRLLGLTISGGGTIAAAAARTYTVFEETAGTIYARGATIVVILGNNWCHTYDFRPNGILLSTVNKKLQITTAGGTYTAGGDAVTAWGTEE
jgi:hypothetical protein